MHNKTDQLKYTQNFLRDRRLVEKLAELAGIKSGDFILEIGPGKGIITRVLTELTGSDGKIIAVELDYNLAERLYGKYGQIQNLEIIHANILELELKDLGEPYKVFSNVPFNITSDLLSFLFKPEFGPEEAFLILQREAIIGTNKFAVETETLKSLLIKPFYSIKSIHKFSKSDFEPQPSVVTEFFAFKKLAKSLIDPKLYNQYLDFMAFVSKDRVGEGNWLKIFTKKQIDNISNHSQLVKGKGIGLQKIEAIIYAFDTFINFGYSKAPIVNGAMNKLKLEQKHKEAIDKAGSHHRTGRFKANRV